MSDYCSKWYREKYQDLIRISESIELDAETRKKMQTYLEQVPNIKVLTKKTFDAMRKGIKGEIIRAFSKGIDEKYGNRKVLNAREIKMIIEGGEKSIKKANLYYHLNSLEDMGIITDAHILRKKRERGKNFVTYYGRTAKMFVMGDFKEKKELGIIKERKFMDFTRDLNPDIAEEDIKTTLDKVLAIQNHSASNIIKWFDTHGDLLSRHEIPLAALFMLADLLKISDPHIAEGIRELQQLLKL